ncbi:hypothetical protein SDC9_168974 [bioreactor metagenome]|uniref:Calcineurin-like phosphoesterase domain-containing protein n=1 Tax=bioreactor metagenome TaxID=1076179 RepID=A0A645GC36_9ZZZZ
MHDDQIEWYEKTSAELAQQNGGEPVPALLFQHMPVPEEYQLLREAKPAESAVAVKGHHIFSSKNYVLKSGVEGQYNEPICSPCYNNGQFDSWKKMGDVRGAFFGHDHTNDFAGYVDGIMLAQCRGTGFNGYADGDRTGVRLIVLNENDLSTFETNTYMFRDFGLTSKSVSLVDSKLSNKQKSTIAKATKIGVGVAAACAATAVAVSKIKKKKD